MSEILRTELQGKCRCCESITSFFSISSILDKVAIYTKCDACLSVQVESPSWIESAHSRAISILDTGLVSRSISASRLISSILFFEGKSQSAGLDWGGGTGLLTRLLRDQGFHVLSYDKYADGELAHGFNIGESDLECRCIFLSAIECFEHLVDPLTIFSLASKNKEYFMFTTELIDTPAPDPASKTWWYYMPESGQHVTFATEKGIHEFKSKLGFGFYTRFGSFHVMSRKKLKLRTRIILKNRFSRMPTLILISELLTRRFSLTIKDKDDLSNM